MTAHFITSQQVLKLYGRMDQETASSTVLQCNSFIGKCKDLDLFQNNQSQLCLVALAVIMLNYLFRWPNVPVP